MYGKCGQICSRAVHTQMLYWTTHKWAYHWWGHILFADASSAWIPVTPGACLWLYSLSGRVASCKCCQHQKEIRERPVISYTLCHLGSQISIENADPCWQPLWGSWHIAEVLLSTAYPWPSPVGFGGWPPCTGGGDAVHLGFSTGGGEFNFPQHHWCRTSGLRQQSDIVPDLIQFAGQPGLI